MKLLITLLLSILLFSCKSSENKTSESVIAWALLRDDRDVIIEQIVTKSKIDNQIRLQLKSRNLGAQYTKKDFSLKVFIGAPAKNTKTYPISSQNILEDFLTYSEWFKAYESGFEFVSSYYENDLKPELPKTRRQLIEL